MAITGGCLCGAVRYSIEATEPLVTRECWCRLCQYLGAGSSTINAGFLTADFTVSGEPSIYESSADSGNKMVRSFCPKCGTPLFSETPARPHLRFVRTGTLDNPGLARPEMTIWAAEAPGWARLDPDAPRLEGQPPPPTAK
jgi:hypothetical protein